MIDNYMGEMIYTYHYLFYLISKQFRMSVTSTLCGQLRDTHIDMANMLVRSKIAGVVGRGCPECGAVSAWQVMDTQYFLANPTIMA